LKTIIALTLTFLFSFQLSATTNIESEIEFIKKNSHRASFEELKKIQDDRQQFEVRDYPNTVVDWRPVEDYAEFKYVLMSSETGFNEVANLRFAITRNLPEGTKLVLLVTDSNAEQIRQTYLKYISSDRLILARDTNIGGGFWARDAFPFPVINSQKQMSLVSARYYRPFNSATAIARSLNLNMSRNNFTFVGGNLLADEDGICFTIDSERRFTTTESDLRNVYGCKEIKVLRHVSGIGDVDEVMKPVGNKTIITNTLDYVNDFKAWGYNVIMLPAVLNSYRTYVNSLVVGKTVFMPTYGISQDIEAQKIYESLGYKVVGIKSNTLSDQMHGSVHCQTMAYPDINETTLLNALGLERM
jgi:hypothetical protein